MNELVDVVVNIFGKPYQTLVSVLSLARHSAKHVGRLFCIEENHHPFGDDVGFIYDVIRRYAHWKLERHVPSIYLGHQPYSPNRLADPKYRRSINYQYAFESSMAKYLFVMHNDMLFDFDVIGDMLIACQAGAYAGVGSIGQCWNCPARVLGCTPDRYGEFTVPYQTLLRVIGSRYVRTTPGMIDPRAPTPLPECRLNEFACLIDLKATSPHVAPLGSIEPFGFFSIDCGVRWFAGLTRLGFKFCNYERHLRGHAWTKRLFGQEPNGNSALFDRAMYQRDEKLAQAFIEKMLGHDVPRSEFTRGT